MPKLGNCDHCQKGSVTVWNSRKYKKILCRNCKDQLDYYDTSKWCECSICSRVRNVSVKRDGKPICQNCYRTYFCPKGNCKLCGKLAPLAAFKDVKSLCTTCRGRLRMKDESLHEVCFSCSKSKPVASRTLEGFPICYSCYVSGFRG